MSIGGTLMSSRPPSSFSSSRGVGGGAGGGAEKCKAGAFGRGEDVALTMSIGGVDDLVSTPPSASGGAVVPAPLLIEGVLAIGIFDLLVRPFRFIFLGVSVQTC